MTPKSRRKIFNIVKDHLLTQRKRAAIRGDCLYHAPNGLKCAVGCLISEAAYKKHQVAIWDDGCKSQLPPPCSTETMIKRALYSTHRVKVDAYDYSMLTALQTLHDEVHPNGWAKGLKRIEDEFIGATA